MEKLARGSKVFGGPLQGREKQRKGNGERRQERRRLVLYGQWMIASSGGSGRVVCSSSLEMLHK